jgi:hypothetical protein
MHKVSMPLAKVAALAPGDLIDIPREQVSRVAVLGANGKQVGLAKLGRQGEHRALRIVQTGFGVDKPGLPEDVFRNPDLSQPPINASGSLSPDDGSIPEPVSARQEDT